MTTTATKEHVRPGQLLWLLIPLILATGIDLTPSATSATAGRAGWISVLVASIAWLPFLYLHLRLGDYAGTRSLVALAEAALGRWPGKAVGLVIALFFLHLAAVVLREASDFIAVTLMPETPEAVVLAVTILLVAWGVAQGAEVLARGAEFYVPVAILTFFILILLLSAHEMDFRNLLPITDASPRQVVMGAAVPLALFSETGSLVALWSVLPTSAEVRRVVWLSHGAITALLAVNTAATIAVFGPRLPARFRYPFLQITEMISLADFLERLDAVHAAVWFGGIVFKACTVLLTALILLRDVLGLSDYSVLAFPAGALLLPASLSVVENVADFQAFVAVAPAYFLLVNGGLPIVVLVACRLRGLRPAPVDGTEGDAP
ncbi:MAG: endospore germination permease [Clostridia bacterium]|nr:endospore germination permease [Clostridia bacterium]